MTARGDHIRGPGGADPLAQRAGDHGREARASALIVGQGAQIGQGVDDTVAQDGVDHQVLLVACPHVLAVDLKGLALSVEADHGVGEGQLYMQPRIVLVGDIDRVVRRAQAQHDRLLGLVDDIKRLAGRQTRDEGEGEQRRGEVTVHWPAPGPVASTVGRWARKASGGTIIGVAAPRASTTTLFARLRIRCIASV